ncbi:MAG: hypothetical protein K2H45_12435, partial [Acetatifactor sp.]|nr:hypothetical protein [Acetatifactor sp.]
MGKKKQKGEVMLIEPAQQTAPRQKKKKWQNIWQLGAILSLIGAFMIFLRYMNLHGIYQEEPSVTKIYNVGVCSRYYNHVLYRDLYNVVSGGYFAFDQLYGQSGGENQELNVSDTMMVLGQYILADSDADVETVRQLWEKIMQNTLNRVYVRLEERLDSLSGQMLQDLEILDYWIQDQKTGSIVTNTLQTEKGKAFSVEEYAVWFEMSYDAAGNLSVTGASDKDVNMLTKTLYENARKSLYDSYIGQSDILSYVNEAVNQILSEDE